MPLVVSRFFADRTAAKSWRILSVSGPLGSAGAGGPMIDNQSHDPSLNDLERRFYSWVVPATAHSARLFGDLRATVTAGDAPTTFTWELVQAAYGAATPAYNPGGTVRDSAIAGPFSAGDPGLFPIRRFGGLVIPVTPLGDLQLYFRHVETPLDGSPLVNGLSLGILGATSPIEDFRIDFRTEFAGGSGSAFGVGDHGEPGGGVW